MTRPAARRPPTTPATGPSGPSTPNAPRPSSASSARTRKTERARLQADYDRALRVIAEIDAAARTSATEELTMRITPPSSARQNENRIRAAMDRLLRGEIPPGGNCDIKTLAREAGVDRTAFYGTRPYAHLRAEFENRLQHLQQAGETPDPKAAQIDPPQDRDRQAERHGWPRLTRQSRTSPTSGPRPWPGSPPSTTRSSDSARPTTQSQPSPASRNARKPSRN